MQISETLKLADIADPIWIFSFLIDTVRELAGPEWTDLDTNKIRNSLVANRSVFFIVLN